MRLTNYAHCRTGLFSLCADRKTLNMRYSTSSNQSTWVDHMAPLLDLPSAIKVYSHKGVADTDSGHEHTKVPKTKPVYITTPIFYVNSVPHVGHLYTTFIADSLARWWKLVGAEVVMTTGTDEHGLKIAQAATARSIAESRPVTPKELCDEVSDKFKELFDKAGINYTRFIRTTDMDHETTVKHMWNVLTEKGFLYKGKHQGWYCISDEVFYAERDVISLTAYEALVSSGQATLPGTHTATIHALTSTPTQVPTPASIATNTQENGKHDMGPMVTRDTGKAVEWVEEENYLLKWMKTAKNQVHEWVVGKSAVIPSLRVNEIINMLNETYLNDLSVSRPKKRQLWGIEVPNDEDHVIYVWLDALTNYLTVAGFPWQLGEHTNANCWPADYHVVGKDIVKFHCIYWPSFLLAVGVSLPHRVVVHGHWTVNSVKMSKSIGNVIDPFSKLEELGSDGLRYFLLKEGRLGSDGDYDNERAINIINADLADTYGNLLSRCTSVKVNPLQSIPEPNPNTYTSEDLALLERARSMPEKVHEYYRCADFSMGIETVMDTLYKTNSYVNDNEPWALAKDPNQSERLHNVLSITMEILRVSSLLLMPVAPETASTALERLGVPVDQRNIAYVGENGILTPGTKVIASTIPLFRKIIAPKSHPKAPSERQNESKRKSHKKRKHDL
eukprot:CFRG4227T1